MCAGFPPAAPCRSTLTSVLSPLAVRTAVPLTPVPPGQPRPAPPPRQTPPQAVPIVVRICPASSLSLTPNNVDRAASTGRGEVSTVTPHLPGIRRTSAGRQRIEGEADAQDGAS